MDFEGQQLQPISNQVEVLNGQSFRDVVLKPRIEPLLAAQTVGELLSVIPNAELGLEALGTKPTFNIERAAKQPLHGPYAVRTVVDLTNARPPNAVGLSTKVLDDLYAVSGRWKLANRLGLGDLLQLSATMQPEPHSLASGRAALTVPTPLGRSHLTFSGFFFNEDRTWASHALATHGVSAELNVPWVAGFHFKAGAQAVARNIHSISDTASDIVRAAAGNSSLKVSALAQLTHISTYHALKAQIETAGKPGDTKHVKAEGEALVDIPLTPGDELVLSFKANAGFLGSNDDKPKICDQFLLGGPANVLGFERNKLRAQGQTSEDFTGGQAYYTSRIALLSKLPLMHVSPLRLKAQVDAGVLQQKSGNDIVKCASSLLNTNAALSSSAGLTYKSEKASFDVLYVLPVRGEGEIARSAIHVGAELNLD